MDETQQLVLKNLSFNFHLKNCLPFFGRTDPCLKRQLFETGALR